MMTKEQKKNYVEEMKKVFSSNEAVMIAHYKGLNVKEIDKIRAEMRKNGIFFKVTKNRITKLALKETKCKRFGKIFYWTYCCSYFIRSNYVCKNFG